MPTYLWSVKDETGRTIGQRIDAASPEAARAILEHRGFTDLRLQFDDFGNALNASLRQTCADEHQSDGDDEFDADEELAFARPRGLLSSLLLSLKAWAWVLVPLLIWNACNFYRGWRWTVLNIIAAVLLAAVVYLFLAFNSLTITYDRLLHAVDAGRWNGVTLYVKLLRFFRWFNRFGVPEHELIFREAQVLFEKNGLETALQHYRVCHDYADVPKSLYWSRVSSLYLAAQDIAKGLEVQKNSFELGEKSASEMVDRAYHLVHYGKDPAAARDMLAQAEQREIPELAASYVSMCHGMIANCEGRFAEAQQAFSAAIEKAQAFSGTPLMAGHIRIIKAHLCVACGRLGNVAEARSLYAQVKRYLEKHHELRLLDDCKLALAQCK